MNKVVLIIVFFISNFVFAQVEITINDSEDIKPKKYFTFSQFDLSIPLQGNKNRGEVFPDGSTNNSWFVPDGINVNFGYGIHLYKWVGITANTGIGTKISEKLVVVPTFLNLRLMPKVYEDVHLGVEYGFGKSFALGRGNLNGDFRRFKICYENDEFQLFIEAVGYGFELHGPNSMGSISVGISVLNF